MKTFARASLLALALGVAGIPAASADWSDDRRHGHSHWDRHDHGPHGGRYGRAPRAEIVTIKLNDRVRNAVLPLRKLADLGRDYAGFRVMKVVVHLRPTDRKQRFNLLGNDRVLDRAHGRERRTVTLRPERPAILGETVRSLQLGVRGTARIKAIDIKLRPQRHAHKQEAPGRYEPADADIQRLSRELGVEIARILLGRSRTSF